MARSRDASPLATSAHTIDARMIVAASIMNRRLSIQLLGIETFPFCGCYK
jgi:hypothetical protein